MVRQHTSKNGSINELTSDEHSILVDAIHDSATVIHKGQRMNERIQELLEQAGVTYAVMPKDTVSEKFAELIVLECTKAVMDGTKEGDHYAQRIENHFDNGSGGILQFGVEE